MVDFFLEVLQQVDQETYEKIATLLEVEDDAIKTYHMDLLSNVRKSGPGHVYNLDL